MRLAQDTAKSRVKLFPLRWWLQLTCLVLLLAGIAWWRAPSALLETSTTTLEPGLTLRKFIQKTPAGAVQIYVVRGEKTSGWKLNMALPQGTVMQRETVSQIATRENALAAVNGGFFAYNGAALGAVKKEGAWIRLPWKNRTALGLKKDGTTRIANLQGTLKIEINGIKYQSTALNGSASADEIAILTPHYGTTYQLRAGESALEITDGKIVKFVKNGGANIRVNGFLIVAKGASVPQIANAMSGQKASYQVETAPSDWDDYPTILGAGPRLVHNGIARETAQEEEFRPDVVQRGSRTAVGIAQNGDVLFVIADGNEFASPGLTLPELAKQMVQEGAQDALHMDCGPSSVLIINGQIANRPWTNQPSGLKEPTVPNALLIAK